jgi:HD-GYP domain-containing protein (c-di-GMP phosphodiesterase class II)
MSDPDRAAQQLGRDFVFALHSTLRALRLYPLENQAVQNALAELELVSGAILAKEGSISLHYIGDYCFVNDLRLRIDVGSFATFGAVSRLLGAHGIGQMEIVAGVTREEWTRFLTRLNSEPAAEDPLARLVERLTRAGVTNILLTPPEAEEEAAATDDAHEVAKKTYVQSVAVAREAMLGVRMGKGVSVRRVKRAVQQIVDQVLHNETSMMGMTVLRDYDQYTFAHSVNVCIFGVALGKKLGLSRDQLYELGMGALMHDMGKVKLPIELTNKSGALEDVEWEMVQEHPTEGLLALMELRGMGALPLRAMLMAYEHHMKTDQSGYPTSIRPRKPTLFSRIVAIADGFDAATTKRSYQANPFLPDQVLREMRDNPKRGLDPLLVKAFISMTGYYPVGSVVILDNYELAVVVAPSTRPEHHNQPVVRVIYDELGLPLDVPRTLDLTEIDIATGRPLRTIIKTTDPEKYGINVRDYFV